MENERVVRARVDPIDNLNPLDHQRAVCLFFDTNRVSGSLSGSSDERARTSPNIVDDFIALSLLSPYLCYRLEPNLTWTRS